jgi:hypothetical protein
MEAYGHVVAPPAAVKSRDTYLLHPALLDCFFQVLLGHVHTEGSVLFLHPPLLFFVFCLLFFNIYPVTFLPTKIRKLTLLHPCHFDKYVVYTVSSFFFFFFFFSRLFMWHILRP